MYRVFHTHDSVTMHFSILIALAAASSTVAMPWPVFLTKCCCCDIQQKETVCAVILLNVGCNCPQVVRPAPASLQPVKE